MTNEESVPAEASTELSGAIQADQETIAQVETAAAVVSVPVKDAGEATVETRMDSGAEPVQEELQMFKPVSLPDPRVEAGPELLESLNGIPDKMAFKIGEAAEMVGVKQYVLRYWETEFEALRPRKSKNNQRIYSRRDIETAMMIKKLLYEDRFSIEGARAALKALKNQVKEERGIQAMAQSQESAVAKLRALVEDIRRIRDIFA